MRAEEHFQARLNASRTFSARQRTALRIVSAAPHRARACLRICRTRSRRRVIGVPPTGRGETPPRLKPDGLPRRRLAPPPLRGLTRRRARTPRVARTRKPGEPFVEARKGLAASLEALIWPCRNGSRGGAGIRCGLSAALRKARRPRQRSLEAGAKPFRASTEGRTAFVSHRRCASVPTRPRKPEGGGRAGGGGRCRRHQAPAALARPQSHDARFRGRGVSCSRDSAKPAARPKVPSARRRTVALLPRRKADPLSCSRDSAHVRGWLLKPENRDMRMPPRRRAPPRGSSCGSRRRGGQSRFP